MTTKQQLVLATGVFDILHQEHITFLQKAKALGYLIVGLESDERVRKIKGPGRPINTADARMANLEKLAIADEVFILPRQFDAPADHKALLERIQPDILAVSSHTAHIEKKSQLMKELGGRVEIVHQHNPEVSTTQLLKEREALD